MIVNIDIQLVYVFILLFSCLFLIVIVAISLYLNILQKYTKLRTAGQSEKDESVINNAQKIAEQIIKRAESNVEKYDEVIKKINDQIVIKWSKNADLIFEKNIKTLNENLANIVNLIYKKENDTLASYKELKLKDFDTLFSEFINKLSKEIIKREIDLSTHKKLIVEALEKAKKDGLFN